MKKLAVLLFTFFSFLCFGMMNVDAKTFTIVEQDSYGEYTYHYTLKLSSDSFPETWEVHTGNRSTPYYYVDGTHKIYSKELIDCQIYNGATRITSFDGPVSVLVNFENLVVGDKYDVYYIDRQYVNHNSVDTIDESLNGTVGTVVEIDGVKYISFTTTSPKMFVLQKQISTSYTNKLKGITTDGVYTLNAANPGNESMFDVTSYTEAVNKTNPGYKIDMISNTYSGHKYMTVEFDDLPGEKNIVEFTYKYDSINPKIQAALDEIAANNDLKDQYSPGLSKYFVIEDLSYINYLNNNATDTNDIVYYSYELRDGFKGRNFVPIFSYRNGEGDGNPFTTSTGGFVTVKYEGILYPLGVAGGYRRKNVIYLPSSVGNTDAELIKAAKERIAKFLGKSVDDIDLTVGGTRASQVVDDVEMWTQFNEENLADNYYNLVINGRTIKMLIEKNDTKAKELEFKSKDVMTDIEIKTLSGAIPFDTLMSAKQISKESDTFKELIKKIGKDTGLMYDLKLFSESIDKYITKLDNGEFEVRIPLTSEYKGKSLSAYYVDDDGKVEEISITPDGDYGVFKTNHFSTYTIAESSTIDNPKTYDNILNYAITGSISLIALVSISLYLNKKRCNQ